MSILNSSVEPLPKVEICFKMHIEKALSCQYQAWYKITFGYKNYGLKLELNNVASRKYPLTSVKAPPETRYLVAKFGTKKVSLSYLQGGNKRKII